MMVADTMADAFVKIFITPGNLADALLLFPACLWACDLKGFPGLNPKDPMWAVAAMMSHWWRTFTFSLPLH